MNSNTQPGTPPDLPSPAIATTAATPPENATPVKGGVPVAIYKEVTAELQVTRAMVNALNARNQQLVEQNHALRQEIDRFVHNISHLQSIASFQEPPQKQPVPTPLKSFNPFQGKKSAKSGDRLAPPTAEDFVSAKAIATQLRGADPNLLNLRAEIKQGEMNQRDRAHSASKLKDLSGIWLLLTVLAVIVTAFGTGFLIVRPFLPSR